MDVQQILLVKFLFDKSNEIFLPDDPFACGLAISLMQDSVEAMIWTVVKELDAPVKERDSFDKVWDSIPKAKQNKEKKELPLRSKMLELNKARVNFKHYGNLPDSSDAIKFISYTEEFLKIVAREFLNINFEETSISDLIKNNDVREKIKEAELEYKNENWKDALIKCAEAEKIVTSTLNKILPTIDNSLSRAGTIFSHTNSEGANQIFQYISKYFEALRSVTIVNLIGVKLPEYLRFKSLIPTVNRNLSGKLYVVSKPYNYSEKETSFCLKYIIDFAIKIQNTIG